MYIDLQVNGYKGVDFSSENLSSDEVEFATDALMQEGTSGYCPTIITSSDEIIERNLALFSRLIETTLGEQIIGVHLEGPFISKEEGAKGCHPEKFIRQACLKKMKKYIDISGDNISLVTLAPEVDGAIELISFLVEQNITVCLGHHMADNTQIEAAVNAGAKASTHLGNGISKQIDGTDNPVINQLINDNLTGMFITDGHHLPDNFIKLAYRLKGIDNFIVTSDSAPVAGLQCGNYHWAGNDIYLSEAGAIFSNTSNTLAGSSSNMANCVEKAKKILNLSDEDVKKIGSINQKKLLGLI